MRRLNKLSLFTFHFLFFISYFIFLISYFIFLISHFSFLISLVRVMMLMLESIKICDISVPRVVS